MENARSNNYLIKKIIKYPYALFCSLRIAYLRNTLHVLFCVDRGAIVLEVIQECLFGTTICTFASNTERLRSKGVMRTVAASR